MHLLRQTPQRQILAQEMKQKLSFSHPLTTVPALPGHFLVNRGLVLVLNIYKDQLVFAAQNCTFGHSTILCTYVEQDTRL